MDLYEIKNIINKVDEEISLFYDDQKIKDIEDEIEILENEMLDPDFYLDKDNVKKTSLQIKENKFIVDSYNKIKQLIADNREFIKIVELDDETMMEDIINDTKTLKSMYQKLEDKVLMNEEYDKDDAILEIHCGAGGTESQDWVEMLYKMYLAYAKSKDYQIELLSISHAHDVGIKSLTMKISGLYAYGYLKNEKGVHRLIRISPFDSNSRRHTTFALVSVSPVFEKIDEIEIDEKDLEIDTFRSSGAGGQSVNTTDSAVRILHKPTKIVVTCQNERSQIQNKAQALKTLKSKILELDLEKQREEINVLKDSNIDINFGSQIRSYTFHPYSMVKDHRSNFEVSDPHKVLNGDLDEIINSVLRKKAGR